MSYVPEAIGISGTEMNLYQKNLARLKEMCASREFQELFPEPLADKDLFAYTTSHRYKLEQPTLFYAGTNENTKSIAVYFPEYLVGEKLQDMLCHVKSFFYYEVIVVFCHKTNFDEVKNDLIDWRPEKIRMVNIG